MNKCFCTSSSRVSFSRGWAFCQLLWFVGWNELSSAHYQRMVHSWQQFCLWIDALKVYKHSPIGSWSRMGLFCSNTLMPPIRILWNLQVVMKNILSWWVMKHSSLTMYFLGMFAMKKFVFWTTFTKAGHHLEHYSWHLVFELFSEQKSLENKVLLFCETPSKEELSRDDVQTKKECP